MSLRHRFPTSRQRAATTTTAVVCCKPGPPPRSRLLLPHVNLPSRFLLSSPPSSFRHFSHVFGRGGTFFAHFPSLLGVCHRPSDEERKRGEEALETSSTSDKKVRPWKKGSIHIFALSYSAECGKGGRMWYALPTNRSSPFLPPPLRNGRRNGF